MNSIPVEFGPDLNFTLQPTAEVTVTFAKISHFLHRPYSLAKISSMLIYANTK